MSHKSFLPDRYRISELLLQVLAGKITVQEAIKVFPQETVDESAECAFHALLHFEADEDYRLNDPEYAEEQEKYLEYIAALFAKGESLPVNIIEDYRKYYETAPILSPKGIKKILKTIFRLIV